MILCAFILQSFGVSFSSIFSINVEHCYSFISVENSGREQFKTRRPSHLDTLSRKSVGIFKDKTIEELTEDQEPVASGSGLKVIRRDSKGVPITDAEEDPSAEVPEVEQEETKRKSSLMYYRGILL